VLEAQDVALDPRSNRAGPRRAAEEGAPIASEGVPAAPPASPKRETVTSTRGVLDAERRTALGGKERVSVRAAPSAAALMSAGANSSSSSLNAHTDDDDDDEKRVGRRVADAMIEKGSTASVPTDASASIASFPPVWVTKWVDYTSKYGLGYRLSDGTFGVVFNDATKMSQGAFGGETNGAGSGSPSRRRSPVEKTNDAAGDRLEYRERARRGSGSNPEPNSNGVDGTAACVSFSASAPPPVGLEKKTKLMRHFRGYLARDGRSAVEKTAGGLFDSFAEQDGSLPNLSSNGDEQSVTPEVLPRAVEETRAAAARSSSNSSTSSSPYLPHVKNWLRTKHAILFRLSNRTIQVNFTDGSEILLSSEAQACVFVNPKTKRRAAHLLAKLPADPELLRRLRYVKEVLHQLVHRA
jgi:polo-like kinase 1